MLFKEAVSERIYELCDKFKMTPNRLAELSTVPPTTLRSMLANNVATSKRIIDLCNEYHYTSNKLSEISRIALHLLITW